jgi:glycosyltransferase involved in cell wall biosynthesis
MFAPALSPWSLGGVAEHAYQLSKQLVQLGCEVHVVCRHVKGRGRHEVVDGIQVHYLVPNRGPQWLFLLKKSVLNDLSKQWKFDLFHGHGPCAAFTETKKPLLTTLHGTSADEAKEVLLDLVDMPRLGIWNLNAYFLHALAVPSTYLPAFFLKRAVRRATRIIAVSQFVKRQAQNIFGVAPQKVEVIYNGAKRSDTFLSDEDEAEPIILYVGYLGVRKGLPYLISAISMVLRKNAKARAVIVGNGSLKPLCQSMAGKLGISSRITFTGAVTEEAKRDWYRKATLCVIPSTYDPSPIVAFEALAAGKPVVASNVGGLPEVIHNKVNGLLVPPRNPEEIAGAVNEILSNGELASTMGKNASQIIEREYTWEHAARKTLNTYRSCIGEIG